MTEQERELRHFKRALRDLSNAILLYLDALDNTVAHRRDVPRDVSSWLGETTGKLEYANDCARHFGLGLPLGPTRKARDIAALKRKAGAS